MKDYRPLLLLLLLAIPLPGLGQQEKAASYATEVTAAQEAMSRSDFKAAAENYKLAVKMHPESAELWANLGLAEHQNGDYVAAIRSFQQAIRLKPSLYVPNLFLGIDSMHTGNASAAIKLLDRAERMNKTDPEAPLELGREYSSAGNYSLAAREFNRAIELDPKLSNAWLGRGLAYLDQVEEDARNLSTEGRNSSYAEALYAESMARQSRYMEAAEAFKKAIASQPQPPCLHAQFGFMYLKEKEMEDAASEFKTARDADAGCGMTVLGEARLHLETGAYSEALPLLGDLWIQDPGFVRANASLLFEGLLPHRAAGFAEFLTQDRASGKIETGLYQSLDAASNGGPEPVDGDAPQAPGRTGSIAASPSTRDNAEALYVAGRYGQCAARLKNNLPGRGESELLLLSSCAYFAGDYALASSASQILSTRPGHPAGGLYWSIKADEILAVQSLTHFEQMAPNSAQSHILLGDIYRQRQRFDDAQTQYQLALQVSPGDHGALLGLAYAYFGNANLGATIETAGSALAASPSDPELNLLMGDALVARHDFAGAEPFLQKALSAKPQMLPRVHGLLGTVYAETGRIQDAIIQLELGLPADRDGSTYYKLARLYRKAGDIGRADAAMQQVKVMEQQRRNGAMIALQDSRQPAEQDQP